MGFLISAADVLVLEGRMGETEEITLRAMEEQWNQGSQAESMSWAGGWAGSWTARLWVCPRTHTNHGVVPGSPLRVRHRESTETGSLEAF